MVMLILRMLSGLLAGAWRLVMPGGREKNRVAKATVSPAPESPIAVPAERVGCPKTDDPYLDAAWHAARSQMCGHEEEPLYHYVAPESGTTEAHQAVHARRLKKAAGWHALAARKDVENLDGEGVLDHMRNFRRYSSAPIKASPPFSVGPCRADGARCTGCGSTCASRDLNKATGACFSCDPGHAHTRPLWTARDGRRIPVEEMGNGHLVNSAAMVRRWLRSGLRPVTDDRIRMCGHVLAECASRGILRQIKGIPHKVGGRHGR